MFSRMETDEPGEDSASDRERERERDRHLDVEKSNFKKTAFCKSRWRKNHSPLYDYTFKGQFFQPLPEAGGFTSLYYYE